MREIYGSDSSFKLLLVVLAENTFSGFSGKHDFTFLVEKHEFSVLADYAIFWFWHENLIFRLWQESMICGFHGKTWFCGLVRMNDFSILAFRTWFCEKTCFCGYIWWKHVISGFGRKSQIFWFGTKTWFCSFEKIAKSYFCR